MKSYRPDFTAAVDATGVSEAANSQPLKALFEFLTKPAKPDIDLVMEHAFYVVELAEKDGQKLLGYIDTDLEYPELGWWTAEEMGIFKPETAEEFVKKLHEDIYNLANEYMADAARPYPKEGIGYITLRNAEEVIRGLNDFEELNLSNDLLSVEELKRRYIFLGEIAKKLEAGEIKYEGGDIIDKGLKEQTLNQVSPERFDQTFKGIREKLDQQLTPIEKGPIIKNPDFPPGGMKI